MTTAPAGIPGGGNAARSDSTGRAVRSKKILKEALIKLFLDVSCRRFNQSFHNSDGIGYPSLYPAEK